MADEKIIIDGIDVSKCEYCLKMTKYRCTIQRDVYKCLCKENPNCYYKQLKRKEQECKELKKELQTQRAFTAHEQKLIYCVAYDETCETGNECKQKKCVFKDRLKYKQALDEIEKYLDAQQKYFDGEDYHNLLDIINKVKE